MLSCLLNEELNITMYAQGEYEKVFLIICPQNNKNNMPLISTLNELTVTILFELR